MSIEFLMMKWAILLGIIVAGVLLVLTVRMWRGEIAVNPIMFWVVIVFGGVCLWGMVSNGTATHHYHDDDDYRVRNACG